MLANLSAEDQRALEEFRRDVVEPSMKKLVILDFWAEWCNPCKQFAPILEKVATAYADRGVVLVKIDVDANKFIANQFKIQSIPTVYAMFQGKPIADLTQARSESQLSAVLDQLLQQLPIDSSDSAGAGEAQKAQLLRSGESALAAGDAARATLIFEQITQLDPENVQAWAGLIRAELLGEEPERAHAIFAQLPDEIANDPAMAKTKATLVLVADSKDSDEMAKLESVLTSDPQNHQARYDLACAQIACDKHDEAVENLFYIIGADRDWNEGQARKKILTLFEALGIDDAWVSEQRRRLSLILFG